MAKKAAQLTVAEYQSLITGIPKFAPSAVFGVASQTFTAAQAVTFLQTLHDASAAINAAKAAVQKARANDTALETQDGQVARDIRDAIALMFSNDATTLQAFGLAPRKPRSPLSTEAQAAANAKAKATRQARGTKGSVQKAAITGNVSGVTITPVLSPTVQPSTPAAAASAAATSTAAPVATATSAPPTAAQVLTPTSAAAGSGTPATHS